MKKVFIIMVFMFLLNTAFMNAQEKINAGLLTDIYFENLELKENEDTKVYTVFFNQTAEEIDFEASFRIGEKTLLTKEYKSKPKDVLKISAPWKIEGGKHKVVVEIIKGGDLFINTHIEKDIDIKKKTILNELLNFRKSESINNTINTIGEIIKNIDTNAERVASRVESTKIESGQNSDIENADKKEVANDNKELDKKENINDDEDGTVLGISTEKLSPEVREKVNYVHDKGVEGISWLIRNWQWFALISGLTLIILIRKNR